jgi:hypothetical protein
VVVPVLTISFLPVRGPRAMKGDVMPDLSARPDLGQLRHQAKDGLRAARRGDAEALGRIQRVSDRVILASAQLAIAREYGFTSWPALKLEVTRRDVLDRRDVPGFARPPRPCRSCPSSSPRTASRSATSRW